MKRVCYISAAGLSVGICVLLVLGYLRLGSLQETVQLAIIDRERQDTQIRQLIDAISEIEHRVTTRVFDRRALVPPEADSEQQTVSETEHLIEAELAALLQRVQHGVLPRIDQAVELINQKLNYLCDRYYNRPWQQVANSTRVATEQDYTNLKIGMPYNEVIDVVGLPRVLSGSFYRELELRYSSTNPQYAADRQRDTVLLFAGGLLKTVILNGVTVNPRPPR